MSELSCLNRDLAIKIVRDLKKLINSWPNELKEGIYSIIAYGSLYRSDFLDDVSDIDILLVFNNEVDERFIAEVLDSLKNFENKYKRCDDYIIFDIAWVLEKELPIRGRTVKTFFKFLTIYAFDFVENSEVVYGVDFRSELKVLEPRAWAIERLARLEKLLEKRVKEKDYKYILIVTGEIIRLAQIVYGEPTIKKNEVIKLFMERVPEYPDKEFAEIIWREYHTPRYKKRLDDEYIDKVIRFSRKTLEIIKKALNS